MTLFGERNAFRLQQVFFRGVDDLREIEKFFVAQE
jgi:hypothetical protein